jgi:hypothetical protein
MKEEEKKEKYKELHGSVYNLDSHIKALNFEAYPGIRFKLRLG